MRKVIVLQLLSALSLGTACTKPSPQVALKELASTANDELIKIIVEKKEVSLKSVLENAKAYGLSENEVQRLKSTFKSEEIEKLVLAFIDPNGLKGKVAPRWVYVPSVSDNDPLLTRIQALDKTGNIESFDGTKDPEKVKYPLITLSVSEKLHGMPSAKRILEAGAAPQAKDSQQKNWDGALMFDKVSFSDIHEPWVKGDAEVYALITYFDKNGKGGVDFVDLMPVDKKDKEYELKQLTHFWAKNKYQILNITFMEHDSRYSYDTIAKSTVAAASGITMAVIPGGQIVAAAVATAMFKLTSEVVDAIPKEAMTDSDDYMDTINTVEKYKDLMRQGVKGEVKLKLQHYNAVFNDE